MRFLDNVLTHFIERAPPDSMKHAVYAASANGRSAWA